MLASCKANKTPTKEYDPDDDPYIPIVDDDNNSNPYHIPEGYMYADDSFIAAAMEDNITYKNTYYVSTTGKASGSGSKTDPLSITEAFDSLEDDTKLIILPGTYDCGEIYLEKLNNIAIYGDGDVSFTTTRGGKEINLIECAKVSRMVVDGITFKDVTANNATGIVFYDSNNHDIVIKNNTFKNINTTKVTSSTGSNAVLVNGEGSGYKNFMIYNNYISDMKLGYNEAISIAGNVEYAYVISNHLSGLTNIGIDFNGNTGEYPDPSLDQPRYCVATLNEVTGCVSPYAECAGIYADGARDAYIAYNNVSKSQYGIEIGAEVESTYPTRRIIVEKNTLSENIYVDIRCGGYEAGTTGNVCDTIIRNNLIYSEGVPGLILAQCDGITINNNEFKSTTPIVVEFNNNYVKNITLYDNIYPSNSLFNYLEEDYSYEEFLKKL